MVTNVTSLLKTVKTVEDEEQRGTRALEASIEAIAQEIRVFDSSDASAVPGRPANPEELLRVSKPLTDATGRAMAAAQSLQQDDVIASANLARKVVSDLLATAKAAAVAAETPEGRYRALDAARDVAIKVRELLQGLLSLLLRPAAGGRDALVPASRAIAQAVTQLVAHAELLKGDGWEDPSDPSVLAEQELLGAANSIEAAARKLAQLRPRSQRPPVSSTPILHSDYSSPLHLPLSLTSSLLFLSHHFTLLSMSITLSLRYVAPTHSSASRNNLTLLSNLLTNLEPHCIIDFLTPCFLSPSVHRLLDPSLGWISPAQVDARRRPTPPFFPSFGWPRRVDMFDILGFHPSGNQGISHIKLVPTLSFSSSILSLSASVSVGVGALRVGEWRSG